MKCPDCGSPLAKRKDGLYECLNVRCPVISVRDYSDGSWRPPKITRAAIPSS